MEFKPDISSSGVTGSGSKGVGVYRPDLSVALNLAFGLAGDFITYPEAKVDESDNDAQLSFTGIEVVKKSDAEQLSYLGTPILFPVIFKGDYYNRYDADGAIEKHKVGDYRLPLTTLVDFRRAKIKRTTRVNGAKGTVKETYGFGDWKIRIRGLCMDEPKHPNNAVEFIDHHNRLIEFEELADTIGVLGDLFEHKGINNIDIDEIEFKQVKGFPRLLAFSLTCESTTAIELEL